MNRLCLTLPPFSPDYSGASAVFYDLNSIVVLHDASGCTGNYTGYDEPRWYGSQKAVYCSGLREIDAILGDDDKLVRKTIAAAACVKPEVIAVMGSPVPMVIGTDLAGIAVELEQSTGIPAFGFPTTGLNFYNKGVSRALLALAERFMTERAETIPDSVNILGLTPMDYGREENASDLRERLQKEGWQVLTGLMMGTTLAEIQSAPEASVNLVVAQAGLDLALWMQARFQIPYVVMTPLGDAREMSRYLREAVWQKKSRIVRFDKQGQGRLLIIGEQVLANSLRQVLGAQYGLDGVIVGALFGLDERLAMGCDLDLPDEASIRRAVNDPRYEAIVADPLLEQLITGEGGKQFYAFPQVAVSSKLYWQQIPRYLGTQMQEWMKKIAEENMR